MTAKRPLVDSGLRLICAAATLSGLVLCHTVPPERFSTGGAEVFLLVTALCAALVLLVRGLGIFTGAGLGFVAGLSAALGLTRHVPVPPAHQLAFTAIAVAALSLLGYLAGSWSGLAQNETDGEKQANPEWQIANNK